MVNLSQQRPILLLVDEDAEILACVGRTLRDEGYDVQAVASADACLDAFHRWQPDLVLLGKVGPHSPELLRTLGDRTPPAPLLVLIDADDEEAVDALIERGALDYAFRRAYPSLLKTRVRRLVNGHHVPPPAHLGNGHAGGSGSSHPRPPSDYTLQEANASLQALIQNSPLAIVSVWLDGTVRLWNPAAERLFGWTAEETIGYPLKTLPEEPHVLDELSRATRGETLTDVEVRTRRRDGTLIDISVSLAPLYNGDGQIDGVMAIIADITDRLRAQAAEREQRMMAEALRDAGAALVNALDPQAVMSRILETVGRVVPHDAANIMLIEGNRLRVTHSRGYPPTLTSDALTRGLSLDSPHFRDMLATGSSCLVADTLSDPIWVKSHGEPWIRSYLGTPIYAYGQIVGFLNLDRHNPEPFTEVDAERLRAFASQVAVAVENAQLYDALRRDASELKLLHRATDFLFSINFSSLNSLEELGLQVARAVVDEFGQLDCGVLLADETTGQFIRLARAGQYGVHVNNPLYLDGTGLVPEALRLKTVIYAPDVRVDPRYIANDPRTRSELVIPLLTARRAVGVLDLQSAQLDAFGDHDRRVLQAFAERAAAAIENMLLYDEIRRYTLELEERVAERTAELHRVKERVEAILNNSSDAILMVFEDGTIQQANLAFNRLFGYQVDQVFGMPLSVIARRDHADTLMNGLREVRLTNRPVRVEVPAVTASGEVFDADVALSPVSDHDHRVSSVVVSLRDITTRKRVERELRNALDREKELSDLKSRFISTVSHEFRTPLSIIMTSTDLLKNYGDRLEQAEKVERLRKIQTEVRNITALLDDLLSIDRANRTGKLEFDPAPVNLFEICQEIVNEFKTGLGSQHNLVFTSSSDDIPGMMDGRLVRRILVNLLTNSIKYSNPGTSIFIDLTSQEDAKIIAIRDEGIGIPEADQKNLFDAFHRGRNVGNIAGTGLGLSIVKHAVEMHGGTITCESQVEVGTTFTIRFPVVRLRENGDEENPGD